MEDDLITSKFVTRKPDSNLDPVQGHIDTLADRLKEAYDVVRENNQIGREKQRKQYDKGTKLVTFQPGEMVYLKQMNKGRQTCLKFRTRWKGPYEVVRRLSDLNYVVRLPEGREIVVNVNKMKGCYGNLGSRRKDRPRTPPPTHVIGSDCEDTDSDGSGRDPEWELSQHYRTQVQGSRRPETDERDRVIPRYSLRSRDAPERLELENEVPADDTEGEAEVELDPEGAELDTPLCPSVVSDEVTDSHGEGIDLPRYNLRPLPGRR
ncbi:hypothetical protein L798_00308 [Zootermopsis nevadensis]|uniref:Integrase p58-like C-terminal domain-containing protein n=1 Tax=Zootermopsis nevadensis TaxID=136037 RepID=A0A067QVT3_ZOONE|nr:hypothetical protein L798_00308 [Zootermopsis nevadensis]